MWIEPRTLLENLHECPSILQSYINQQWANVFEYNEALIYTDVHIWNFGAKSVWFDAASCKYRKEKAVFLLRRRLPVNVFTDVFIFWQRKVKQFFVSSKLIV